MQTGYRFRCYPTPGQEKTLLGWIGCQRYIHNAKTGEDRYFRAFARRFVGNAGEKPPVDQKYAQFIGPDTAWLRDVPSPILRNGAAKWKHAYSRFFAGLGGRPGIKTRHGPQSVWLTREVFRFSAETDRESGEVLHRLHVGTKKHPVGEIAYKAHRAHGIPASVVLVLDAGKWFLTFSEDDGAEIPDPAETAARLAALPAAELAARAVGVDRGIVLPAVAGRADGRDRGEFGFSENQRRRMEKKARARRRWQRRMARRAKRSGGRRKARHRVAALSAYARNVRRDFAHQTSHALVADPDTDLVVFEALRVRNMTGRPAPKTDEAGRFVPNRAAAKAGLNKRILESAWGETRRCTEYKALRAGKLVVEAPAAYSSQECAECDHTHPDNRPEQAVFVCRSCGHEDNADRNAAKVIAKRGVAMLRRGEFRPPTAKRTMSSPRLNPDKEAIRRRIVRFAPTSFLGRGRIRPDPATARDERDGATSRAGIGTPGCFTSPGPCRVEASSR